MRSSSVYFFAPSPVSAREDRSFIHQDTGHGVGLAGEHMVVLHLVGDGGLGIGDNGLVTISLSVAVVPISEVCMVTVWCFILDIAREAISLSL